MADVATAVGETQELPVDQWGEGPFQDGPEVIVDRVHLQHHDFAVGVQLVQHVQRRNRGDVAGAEHQRDLPVMVRVSDEQADAVTQGPRSDTRLHPHLAGEPVQQQALGEVMGCNADDRLAVRALPDRQAAQRIATAVDRLEGLRDGVEPPQHGVRPRHPFLALQRRAWADALRPDRQLDPFP